MKRIILFQIILLVLVSGCTERTNGHTSNKKGIDRVWLDSIIKNSDSSYTKPYGRTDFVSATFHINKKDSTICQVMKDSADSIRQIIIAKNNVRSFFAQYYPNGSIQANLPLDEFGQYHGTGTFYYQDGTVQSSGVFNNGLKKGQWKYFNQKGKQTSADNYDKNGEVIK